MNRICELISDGHAEVPVAILYHGEADWAGGKCMYSQEPARRLADHQIDYHFIPSDVFTEVVRPENAYHTYGTVLGKTLKVNKQEYRALIVPECSYVTAGYFAEAAGSTFRPGLSGILYQQPAGGNLFWSRR